jgi:hypothetical protein
MMLKTMAGWTFAAACLTAIATMPAHSQMAGTYSAPARSIGPQTYQGGTQGGMSGAEVVTNGPQTSQGDVSPSWSARQNVIQSERYDRLLESNRGFRQARMRKECGPITDPELHQQCLASFGQEEPYTGSSTSRRSYRTESGR